MGYKKRLTENQQTMLELRREYERKPIGSWKKRCPKCGNFHTDKWVHLCENCRKANKWLPEDPLAVEIRPAALEPIVT